jgi:hypothetical protein
VAGPHTRPARPASALGDRGAEGTVQGSAGQGRQVVLGGEQPLMGSLWFVKGGRQNREAGAELQGLCFQ